MNFTGALKSAYRDIATGKIIITFEASNDCRILKALNAIKDEANLDIKATKHRKKRSLDANATLWWCLDKIAAALSIDKWDVYLLMLKRYGKFTHIVVKENMVDAVKAQWRECEVVGNITVNGKKAVQMLCYFGSSTLNSAEFSRLLNGVISEMEEMGLETPTSLQIQAALESWDKQCQKS